MWRSKRAKPGLTSGLRLVQGPEACAATARRPRGWVRASFFGGDLRGVLRRPFVVRVLRRASAFCIAACDGCAEASSVHLKKRVCRPYSLCANFFLTFSLFLELTPGFWTALRSARTWKLLGNSP